jgi:hypothetical protein
MGRWTGWKKLAEYKHWYIDELPGSEPGCYELAVGGPRGGNLQILYVDESGNLRQRLATYGRSGSHLKRLIDDYLSRGKTLFFRTQRKTCKDEAVKMQDRQLRQYKYGWNTRIPR